MRTINEETTAYRLSRFAHFLELKDVVAVFHALYIRTIFVNKVVAPFLQQLGTGFTLAVVRTRHGREEGYAELETLIARMIEIGYYVPTQSDEMGEIAKLRHECLSTPEITGMYVMLTDRCNFGCGYCFIEQPLPRDHIFSVMSPEIAGRAIDSFLDWSVGDYERTIIFCGGEPLLNTAALVTALSRLEERVGYEAMKGFKLQVITNGSLVDEAFVELAVKYGLKVSVSIDGMAEYHDYERKTCAGGKTHHLAVSAYRRLQVAGVTVGVSFTIGQHHLGHLLENVQWLIEELGIKSIGFNTLMDIDRNRPVSVDYVERINREMLECFEVLREHGVYEDRIMRKVESFIEGTPYLHDCSGCGHQVVFAPDGRVGVCHGYSGWQKYFVEPTAGFRPEDHPYWKEWLNRSPINMPQCYGCEAVGICGGGCACSADVRNGSIWTVNQPFCIHARLVLHWMLEDLYQQTQQVG